MKWKSDSKFIVTGKESNVIIELSNQGLLADLYHHRRIWLFRIFQMFRTDIPDEQIKKAKEEVLGKIPPSFNPSLDNLIINIYRG